MMFEQMYAAVPGVQSARRAIAVTSKTRSPILPNVPTMAESGFPTFEVLNWRGIVGPKGLPADIVKMLTAGNLAGQGSAPEDARSGQRNCRRHAGAVRRIDPQKCRSGARSSRTPRSS